MGVELIFLRILPLIMPLASDVLKSAMKEILPVLRTKADSTPNNWDNVVVDVIESLFGIDKILVDDKQNVSSTNSDNNSLNASVNNILNSNKNTSNS